MARSGGSGLVGRRRHRDARRRRRGWPPSRPRCERLDELAVEYPDHWSSSTSCGREYDHEASHVWPHEDEALGRGRAGAARPPGHPERRAPRRARGGHPAARRRDHQRRDAASRRARPRPGGRRARGPERRADRWPARPPTMRALRAMSIVDAAAVPVHVRIGDRGPPGQDVRPDLRRHPRRDHQRRPQRARRLRDGHDDRPRAGPRRDHDAHLRRLPGDRPRHGPRHRLHPGRLRLRLPDLRHARLGQGPVAGHRPGRRRRARGPRRRGPGVRARRRRPGDDVRVRLPRDARAHAAADRPGPSHGPAPGRGPQVRPAARTCAPTARPR